MTKRLIRLLVAFAAALQMHGIHAVNSCVMTTKNQCVVESLAIGTNDDTRTSASAWVYPGGDTRCAFDDFKDKSTAFATNKTYFFQVFPEQTKDKLLLYFAGGGGCVDDDSCSFGASCALVSMGGIFTPNAQPANNSGIFDKTNAQNPFKDWNIVHLTYCTGDLHLGNVTRDLPVSSLLGRVQPTCATRMPIHQVGYINTMAVLDWAVANYPAPKQIVIGGMSAGSLAAQAYANVVAQKWQISTAKQKIQVSVMADSYMGVVPEATDAGNLLKYYGACANDFAQPKEIMQKCVDGSLTLADFMGSILKALPESSWLFIDSKADKSQRKYYQMIRDGLAGFPFQDLMDPNDFYQRMLQLIAAYQQVTRRISTFFAPGDQHGFLPFPILYSTLDDGGTSLTDFIAQWTANSAKAPTQQPALVPTQQPSSTPLGNTANTTAPASPSTQAPTPSATATPVRTVTPTPPLTPTSAPVPTSTPYSTLTTGKPTTPPPSSQRPALPFEPSTAPGVPLITSPSTSQTPTSYPVSSSMQTLAPSQTPAQTSASTPLVGKPTPAPTDGRQHEYC